MTLKSQLASCIVFSLFLVPVAAATSQGDLPAAVGLLKQNPKLRESHKLLSPLALGREQVEVIVRIQSSPEAARLAEEARRSDGGVGRMVVEGGPELYNLKSDTVKNDLQQTVKRTVGSFVDSRISEDIQVKRIFRFVFGFSATVSLRGLQQLTDDDRVISIEENRVLRPHLSQGIALMNATSPRSMYDGSGIAIAICDTGIDSSHPRLGGGDSPFNGKVIGGYDFGMDDADPRPSGDAHGTACGGIAAGDRGSAGNYIGGVAPGAKLYSLKISNDFDHSATYESMLAAWEWAVAHQNDDPNNPIKIISTSFGGGKYSSTCDGISGAMTQAAANAVAAGITIFVSSGNDGYCDSVAWPSCISHVNSVGAVYDADIGRPGWCVSASSCAPKAANSGCPDGFAAFEEATRADQVTLYSNTAPFLTLLAASNHATTTDIVGTGGYSGGDYASSFGGTSAACPYAAGAAAVLQHAAKIQTGSYLTPAQVQDYLSRFGDTVIDGKVPIGKPRINLAESVDSLLEDSPVDFFWPLMMPAIRGK